MGFALPRRLVLTIIQDNKTTATNRRARVFWRPFGQRLACRYALGSFGGAPFVGYAALAVAQFTGGVVSPLAR
jgi:hypothetical protein